MRKRTRRTRVPAVVRLPTIVGPTPGAWGMIDVGMVVRATGARWQGVRVPDRVGRVLALRLRPAGEIQVELTPFRDGAHAQNYALSTQCRRSAARLPSEYLTKGERT